MWASMNGSHDKLKSKKLKGTCAICMSEKLFLRKHEERKCLSPVIITSQEIRRHYLIIQNIYVPTHWKKDLFFNCSSTLNRLFQNHQRFSKMRQQSDINNIPDPNSISLTQGVKILEEKGVSSKPRVYESSSKADKSQIIQYTIPLRMVVRVDFPKKRVKHSGIRKVSSSNHGKSEHDLDSVMKDIESDQHVDPNIWKISCGTYWTISYHCECACSW